ncbi:elongation factor G [Sporomusaceae bacterium BoRhaA]|uniref:elongation factor G n=1 Tax=Pelorhabdus rhamnosifermentans TaxID=2772457 RepID=UPI001C061E40|nr:elongation factor G [Pelorhabdus rhamnosifermentans]MBU2701084.1 elongation factor G [Pelorhabdus rhamnosifermentans]
MKEYKSGFLRNVGIVSHSGAGKTSLVEACLYQSGTVNRLGRVDDGTTTTDFEPEELKRKITISTGIAFCEWLEHKVNLLDTPGYADFIGEVQGALRAADSAVLTICASSGIEVETEKSWELIQNLVMPHLLFINKLDRENADFFTVVDACREKFGNSAVPLQIPIGQAEEFRGIVDLVEQKAYIYDKKSLGKKVEEVPIPAEILEQMEFYRQMMIESVIENDDYLLAKYLEGETVTEEEIKRTISQGVVTAQISPILCGSALWNMGTRELLDALVSYFPSPDEQAVKGTSLDKAVDLMRKVSDPFSAFIFKTTADPFVGRLSYVRVFSGNLKQDAAVLNATKNKVEKVGHVFSLRGKQQSSLSSVIAGDIAVISKMAEASTGDTLCDKERPIVYPSLDYPVPMYAMRLDIKKGEEDKVNNALLRLQDEDPTFQMVKDTENHQLIVRGLGEIHLDIMMEKMQRKFGVAATLELPKVPYRETIRSQVKVEGKHKKQSGGHGQYGHVWLQIDPLPAGEKFEFVDAIFGGAVPKQYIPAVEKGVREALQTGVLAGYPLVDVKVTLTDGSYHAVDSSEMAFKTASSIALRKGVMQANPILLEPIYKVEVKVPESLMGDVVSTLNSKRGRILGMAPTEKGWGKVAAHVPLAELFHFPVDLRSLSQGWGSFIQKFVRYEEVPEKVADAIIASHKEAKIN